MNNKWKWVLGLALATIAFIISPFAWGANEVRSARDDGLWHDVPHVADVAGSVGSNWAGYNLVR
jgi:hypothetical protein